MVIVTLGFDTSTEATAVGLRLGDGTVLQARDDPTPDDRPGHATRLLPLAGELLERAHLDWSALERIAVGIGPGTFTGLRIGVAAARGLAQSLDIPLVGVSSLSALAEGVLAQDGEEPDGVVSVIDARRGEVFVALYPSGDTEGAYGAAEDGDPYVSGPQTPLVLAPDALGSLLARAEVDLVSERWLAVGNGTTRYRELFAQAGLVLPADGSPLHRISGEAICNLSDAIEPGERDVVTPQYLRRPDAEITLEQARS